eukprot:7112642-Lingulodinium_polyedra.AAC.1
MDCATGSFVVHSGISNVVYDRLSCGVYNTILRSGSLVGFTVVSIVACVGLFVDVHNGYTT